MSDPIDAVRRAAPPVDAHPELIRQTRNDLMATIAEQPRAATASPRRRRRWAVPVASAALLSAAAAGWAFLRDASTATSVQCPGNIVVDAVTGDPVVDCANEWRRHHETEPAAMVAYDNGHGGVVVLWETDPEPAGYTPLLAGEFQDPSLIELEATLDDPARGLASGCYDEATASELAQGHLDRLGLSEWQVTVDESRVPDGTHLCASFVLDPSPQQVRIIGLEGMDGVDPYAGFAAALADELDRTCVQLEAAADLTRALAASTDIVADGNAIDLTEEAGVLVVHTVPDPEAACTRATVNVGGRVEVTLRGPAR